MLAPAIKLPYLVAGKILLIDAEDDFSALAVSNLFERWFVNPLFGFGLNHPDATIKIRCSAKAPAIPKGLVGFQVSQGGTAYTDGQTLCLDFDGSLVKLGPGMRPEAEVWLTERFELNSEVLIQMISQALSGVLRRCGLFELHSGGVVPPGRDKAILIAGASGSGKSTITVQLTTCGWGYLSDDTLLIEEGRQYMEAWGLRRFFALTADTMAAVRFPQHTGPAEFSVLKKRFAPQDFFPSGQIKCSPAGTIVFPVVTLENKSCVRSLTPSVAMARLLRLCPWACYDKSTAGQHLRALGRLVRETAAFEILAGTDLLSDPARSSDLLIECARVR